MEATVQIQTADVVVETADVRGEFIAPVADEIDWDVWAEAHAPTADEIEAAMTIGGEFSDHHWH